MGQGESGVGQRLELGRFLQSRRAALRPDDVGLVAYGERRRVSGLRREELAQLAGVSVSYYTRLEQGQSRNASDGVLDAIARALRLDPDEHAYLRNLAQPQRAARRTARNEQVRPEVRRLIDAAAGVPMVVLGRSTDVLACNRLGHALLLGHLDPTSPDRPADRPNMTRLIFLDAHMRDLYADWRLKARSSVAHLRTVAGRYPDDARVTALIGELTVKSPEFAALWHAHPVRRCETMLRDLRHPLVGELTLTQQVWNPAEEPDQMLISLTAEPDSASDAALRLLAQLTDGGQRQVPPVSWMRASRSRTS
jgi:transcriptional regulator with XRE-family HTH domain